MNEATKQALKQEARVKLLRQVSGSLMQGMKPLADDPTRMRCFCCQDTMTMEYAGKQFYGDFKGTLVCAACDNRVDLVSAEQLADYFSGGFPKCCDETMVWHTQYDQEKDLP